MSTVVWDWCVLLILRKEGWSTLFYKQASPGKSNSTILLPKQINHCNCMCDSSWILLCVSEINLSGGLILGFNQFLRLPQLPQKIQLTSKVVKSDPKIIIQVILPRLSLNPWYMYTVENPFECKNLKQKIPFD